MDSIAKGMASMIPKEKKKDLAHLLLRGLGEAGVIPSDLIERHIAANNEADETFAQIQALMEKDIADEKDN
jgi:hypothetical protein